MYIERIKKIQEYLIKNNIDAYVTFLSDDHGSEYITNRFKSISYLSGFTGSAGTLLICKDKSYLWTDGRYFLQASQQLKQSNTNLMKQGIDISLADFIKENVNALAMDFTVANVNFVSSLLKNKPSLKLVDKDLVNDVWEHRPSYPNKKVFILEERAYKLDAKTKCHKTLSAIKHNGNYGVLVTALDEIAWLTNSRGMDISYNPVFYSFLFLSKVNGVETYTLYVKSVKLKEEIKAYFASQNIIIKPYNRVYSDVKKFGDLIYYNAGKTNYKLYNLMSSKRNVRLWPTMAKAIKTSIDIKDTKEAHVRDGIAMCKFLYYLKSNVGKKKMTEISVSDHLEHLRRQQGAFDLSFNTICGYMDHGAIVHYAATPETDREILNNGLLLVDSGGQYFYGTTDITRTIAFANITDDMKYHFTLVLKSHIALASQVFDKTMTDADLDKITRKPLWDVNLDYNHGTGHGVGHMLNVHEGPQNIRYNKVKPMRMRAGMVTSDEPGLYLEGKYGIRHENEILCVHVDKEHLGFEPLTYVPFDLDAVNVSMLNEDEKKWLNNYHKMVFNKISPFLKGKELAFLAHSTREI